MKKVETFQAEHSYDLVAKVNDFLSRHNILQISYSTCKSGYTTWHYCMVLYED